MRYLGWIGIAIVLIFGIGFAPVRAGDATVSTCDFASFQAAITTANAGGGTIDFTCSGTITVTTDVVISAAVIINGGGIILDGGDTSRIFVVNNGASLTLNNITLQNAFTTGDGSAVYALGNVTINDSIIQDNRSNDDAGAIYITPPDVLTVNNSIFRRNSTNGVGGAIGADGNIVVNGSVFDSNTANNGGAFTVSASGSLTINQSTISNNTASNFSGAIHGLSNNTTINNSTFYNNTAGTAGGVTRNLGVITINHSTFSNNSAPSGGTFENLGAANLTVTNSIISGTGSQCNNGATFNVNASNLTDNTCGGATVVADLFLGAFNGMTVPLLSISPAVDFYAPACSLPTDQNGSTRPQGAGCDAGAVEFFPTNLNATSVCIGNDLHVTITSGDPFFQIIASSVVVANNLGLGTHIITAFGSQTGVSVAELGGDTQIFPFGDIDCTPNNLSASGVCVGNALHITIGNGEAPFQINANSVVFATGLSAGLHIIPNAGTQTGVSVSELTGDTQNVVLGDFNCVVIAPPPPPPPTVATATVLGCALDSTDGLDIANAPDNTYCRVLMRNGNVVSYSGAIPADLIGLGVILAVDVYRLEGGMSINTFPDYARVCLAGAGRLFYMDSRNAPRYSIELATETEGNLTCGWIPAPGTLILTN